MKLAEESRQKSAFTTHCGLFEFIRMPFGCVMLLHIPMANAGGFGLDWNSCFVYLDDILIASKTFDEHMKHFIEVFNWLRKATLRLKPKSVIF